MSRAPRPQIRPSATLPANGGWVQPGPAGTTSMWWVRSRAPPLGDSATEPGVEVGAAAGREIELDRDAFAEQQVGEEGGGLPLVAGRVRGVDAHVLGSHRGRLRELGLGGGERAGEQQRRQGEREETSPEREPAARGPHEVMVEHQGGSVAGAGLGSGEQKKGAAEAAPSSRTVNLDGIESRRLRCRPPERSPERGGSRRRPTRCQLRSRSASKVPDS